MNLLLYLAINHKVHEHYVLFIIVNCHKFWFTVSVIFHKNYIIFTKSLFKKFVLCTISLLIIDIKLYLN